MSEFQKYHAIIYKCVEEYFHFVPHLEWNRLIVGDPPDGYIRKEQFEKKFCKDIADRFNADPNTSFNLDLSKGEHGKWIKNHEGETVIGFVSAAAMEATRQAGGTGV